MEPINMHEWNCSMLFTPRLALASRTPHNGYLLFGIYSVFLFNRCACVCVCVLSSLRQKCATIVMLRQILFRFSFSIPSLSEWKRQKCWCINNKIELVRTNTIMVLKRCNQLNWMYCTYDEVATKPRKKKQKSVPKNTHELLWCERARENLSTYVYFVFLWYAKFCIEWHLESDLCGMLLRCATTTSTNVDSLSILCTHNRKKS